MNILNIRSKMHQQTAGLHVQEEAPGGLPGIHLQEGKMVYERGGANVLFLRVVD